MLSEYDPKSKKITHKSVNACLLPLCQVDHKAITTLEGLGAVVLLARFKIVEHKF